jgi:hypothetical protein
VGWWAAAQSAPALDPPLRFLLHLALFYFANLFKNVKFLLKVFRIRPKNSLLISNNDCSHVSLSVSGRCTHSVRARLSRASATFTTTFTQQVTATKKNQKSLIGKK